jgi:hypothetical protein
MTVAIGRLYFTVSVAEPGYRSRTKSLESSRKSRAEIIHSLASHRESVQETRARLTAPSSFTGRWL